MSGSTRNGGGHARGSSQSQRRRQPSTWVFYVVQGGVHGDNADTPNAFKVMKHVSELRLEDVRDAFPLTRRTGARFHFRFKVAAGGEVRSRAGGNASGDYCYMDLVNPADNVPTFEGHVHIKALQLGACVPAARCPCACVSVLHSCRSPPSPRLRGQTHSGA